MLNTGFLKDWFGFDRKDRRGSFILLVIVFILILLRIIVPFQNANVEDVSPQILALVNGNEKRNSTQISFTSGTGEPSEDNPDVHSVPAKDNTTFTGYNESDKQRGRYTGINSGSDYKIQKFHGRKRSVPVNLNHADTAELKALPGIGTVLSARIIKYRNLLGGYSSVEQLREVYGLTEETFELIREMVFADTTSIRKIFINTAEKKELSRFPYLEDYEITAIIKYRELHGKILSTEELVENRIITSVKADKIRPYINTGSDRAPSL